MSVYHSLGRIADFPLLALAATVQCTPEPRRLVWSFYAASRRCCILSLERRMVDCLEQIDTEGDASSPGYPLLVCLGRSSPTRKSQH